jgi:hypothetical protein
MVALASHDEPLFVVQALFAHCMNTRAIRERLGLDSDSDASQIVCTSFLIAASCTPLKLGTQLMPMRDSAGAHVRSFGLGHEERPLTLDNGAAVDGVLVARHAAGDGDGRAARAVADGEPGIHGAVDCGQTVHSACTFLYGISGS